MKNILIRTDSSSNIGAGHLMRDLVLAQKYKNANITFACQDLSGNINSKVKELGYKLEILISNSFKELNSLIKRLSIDFLIIDHYEIDITFEKSLKEDNQSLTILCFDDTYEKHYCDILLNHNICAKEDKYKKLVPSFCELRCGRKYTLIRDEFKIEKRNIISNLQLKKKRVLLALGGADVANLNIKVLEALKKFDLDVDIVTTTLNVNLRELKSYVLRNESFILHINTKEMAKIMRKCSFTIITPSVTANEVFFMEIPFLAIKVTENQQEMFDFMIQNKYKALDKFNKIELLENIKELIDER